MRILQLLLLLPATATAYLGPALQALPARALPSRALPARALPSRALPPPTLLFSAPPAASSPAASSPAPIRVGVIGCGRIGLVHMKAIQSVPGCAVTMCSNPTLAKAEAAAAAFGVPVATADARDVLTSADVDAVWICSPSQYHAEQIVLAAENGKHVFCEKPISNNLEEAVEAVLACRERGVKLMIGLQRRFDPNFRRVKEAVDKRQVGEELVQIKLCSRDPGAPPKSYVEGGGGLFVDMAVHDLDMSRFLAGAEPLAVLAVGSTKIDASIADLPGSEKFDTASIMVKYPKGVVATIDVCRQSSYGYDQRAEVLGTGGMIVTENVYPSTAHLYTPEFTGNADMPLDFFLQRYDQAYIDESVAFCTSLVNNLPPPCEGRDGLVALVMAKAADMSAELGRWVEPSEVVSKVFCDERGKCVLLCDNDLLPEGFQPAETIDELLVQEGEQGGVAGFFAKLFGN